MALCSHSVSSPLKKVSGCRGVESQLTVALPGRRPTDELSPQRIVGRFRSYLLLRFPSYLTPIGCSSEKPTSHLFDHVRS